jgi:hypothetical protein
MRLFCILFILISCNSKIERCTISVEVIPGTCTESFLSFPSCIYTTKKGNYKRISSHRIVNGTLTTIDYKDVKSKDNIHNECIENRHTKWLFKELKDRDSKKGVYNGE